MSTLTASIELQIIQCPACQRSYAIGKEMRLRGENWRCPYLDCTSPDSTWHRAEKTESERLREELAAKDQEIARQKENAQFWHDRKMETAKERDHFRRSRGGVRGAFIKVKTRVARGVCPCCTRTFVDSRLEKHIKTKHPHWVSTEVK